MATHIGWKAALTAALGALGTAATTDASDYATAAQGALADTAQRKLSQVFAVASYGTVDTTGADDSSAAVLAAITAANAAGGGVVQFPGGTLRIDSQITFPTDAGGAHAPIILRGIGAAEDGVYGNPARRTGGTLLDLRYTGTGGKIAASGWGLVGIESLGLTQTVAASDSSEFIRVLNSTLRVRQITITGHASLSGSACIQDGIILGSSTGALFQGYGSNVSDVAFDRIRTGIALRQAANSVYATNCLWTINCGSSTDAAAIDVRGTGDQSAGNVFINMLTEGAYMYRVMLKDARRCTFIAPGFWDIHDEAPFTACVRIEGSPRNGHAFLGVQLDGTTNTTKYVSAATAGTQYTFLMDGVQQGSAALFGGGWNTTGIGESAVSIMPTGVPLDGAWARMFQIRRSLAEAVDPGLETFTINYDGKAYFKADTTTPGINISSTSSGAGIVKATGPLALYAGSGASDTVRVARGTFRISAVASASRPSSGIGAGCMLFDTTLGKPIWSDGSNWRDAAGTIV